MKWIKIDDNYYNANHIVIFYRRNGTLYIWDTTEDCVEYSDISGEKYASVCKQLGIEPIEFDEKNR